jgi:hypothetical protein
VKRCHGSRRALANIVAGSIAETRKDRRCSVGRPESIVPVSPASRMLTPPPYMDRPPPETTALHRCVVLAAQDKYTLKVPNGLTFSAFRGYENGEDARFVCKDVAFVMAPVVGIALPIDTENP